MNTESIPQLQRQRAVMERKLASLDMVDSSVLQTGWARVEGLRLDDELYNQDLEKWIKNLEVAVGIREKLAGVRPRYLDQLSGIDNKLALAWENTPFGYILDTPIAIRDFSPVLQSKSMVNFMCTVPEDSSNLIKQVFTSSGGRRILTIIDNFIPEDEAENTIFDACLAGALSELFSHFYLKQKYEFPNVVLLSPDEVNAIYQNAHAEKADQFIYHYGLNFGIPGISIPDGLLITEDDQYFWINTAIECKSTMQAQSKNGLLRHQRQISAQSRNVLINNLKLRGTAEENPNHSYLGNLIHVLRPELRAKPLMVNSSVAFIYSLLQFSQFETPLEKEFIPITSGQLSYLVYNLKNMISQAT